MLERKRSYTIELISDHVAQLGRRLVGRDTYSNYVEEVPDYKRAGHFGDPVSGRSTIDLNPLVDPLLRVDPAVTSSAKQAVIFLSKGALNALYKGRKHSLKCYNKHTNTRLLIYVGLDTRYREKSSLNRSLDPLDNLGDLRLGLRVVVLHPRILLDLEVELLFGFLYGRALWFG